MVRNMKVTLTEKINWTKYNLTYPGLDDIIQMIRTGDMQLHDNEFGDYTLQQAIAKIRSVAPGDMQKWKARLLPAVAYNGIFRELSSAGLIEYSCVTALDFDHIATPDEMIWLRNKLMITECVLSVFVTPSGNGLKALVLHDNTDPARHEDFDDLRMLLHREDNRGICSDFFHGRITSLFFYPSHYIGEVQRMQYFPKRWKGKNTSSIPR